VAFIVKLLIKNSGTPDVVCTRFSSNLPALDNTTCFKSAGLFLYESGLLYCSASKQAKVHNGVYDANNSKGFGTIETSVSADCDTVLA
jgi:hypothetical protein